MPFDPDYVRLVLTENFEDAKSLFLSPLMAIEYAHLVMLAEQGIVSGDDARRIRDTLDAVDLDAVKATPYDGTCEDLFFHVERLLTTGCGKEVAGHLHTARSRNDIDMTMYRLRLRELVLALIDAALGLRQSLLDLASRHGATLFPAHTHTQPAQPTTLAHYLIAVVEQLERDHARLAAAYGRTNRNPLGACAITGTGFPINRERTSELLGFDGPTGNTYGSIATVDYLLESTGAAATALAGIGRFVQDLLFWCTVEIGYLRLADGFVQTSSIMPQKRNPVALEHARALASRALGQTTAILIAVHNTPFGDVVDTEDDLQPLVALTFRDATRAVTLVAVAMATAEFNVERMRSRAGEGGVTATELADTLARDYGLPFRAGHAIARRVVLGRAAEPAASLASLVRQASGDLGLDAIELKESDLERILSPEHFVEVRRTAGGPAPEVTAAAIEQSRSRLDEDRRSVAAIRDQLARAKKALEDASKAL